MQIPFTLQIVNLLAALLLLIVFAMLSQRRILSLINLFALQGLALSLSTLVVAYSTNQPHLYYSAGLTLLLKVLVLPWLLHRLIRRLNVRWDVETLLNIPTTMLVGIALVIFAFNLAAPITQLAQGITRGLIGIALASVLLSLLMMLTRRKAVSQVVAFLSLENGLFFAATSATQENTSIHPKPPRKVARSKTAMVTPPASRMDRSKPQRIPAASATKR